MRRLITGGLGLVAVTIFAVVVVLAVQGASTADRQQVHLSPASTAPQQQVAAGAAATEIATSSATAAPSTTPSGTFQWHPLVGASADEINQYAVAYTDTSYSVTRTPTIRLSEAVTWQQAVTMGLPPANPASAPDHYYVVILQGDFAGPQGSQHPANTISYIAYVFDLEHGLPTTTVSSPDGAAVKTALGDSSLPDSPAPIFQGTPIPNPIQGHRLTPSP